MAASNDSTVQYRCPQCQARLTARPEDAGLRRECPQCGKPVKVPGTTRRSASVKSARPAAGPQHGKVAAQGIANVAVICPVCGTRMYAAAAQVGGTMICPDCLETVAIEAPEHAPPPKTPPAESNGQAWTAVPTQETAAGADRADAPADGGDDYQLEPPVDTPHAAPVPDKLLDILSDNVDPGEADSTAPGAGDESPDASDTVSTPQSAASEFSVRCPVCDTMLYAAHDEIGATKTCPDCFSAVVITPPKPKHKRVSDVVMPAAGDDEFTLEEPADLAVFRDAAEAAVPTPEEMYIDDAKRKVEQQECERPELPARPLWTGVWKMLFEPTAMIRWGLIALFLFVLCSLTIWIMANVGKGGVYFFYVLGTTIASCIVTALGGTVTSISCLAVLQDSADGADKVRSWPDLNFVDWMFDSLYVVLALFYSITPGVLLSAALGCAGVPAAVCSWLTAIGCFALYPIVQLSLLEGASLSSPFTEPILASVRTQTRLWLGFYAFSGSVMATVGVVGMFVPVTSSTAVFVVSIVWAGCLLFYFRLLGRLAWACRERARQVE